MRLYEVEADARSFQSQPVRQPRPPRVAAPPARVAPGTPPPPDDDLADERRLRESGGPDDRAMYTCSCGYVFQADVTTSVTCPHCGTGQAW